MNYLLTSLLSIAKRGSRYQPDKTVQRWTNCSLCILQQSWCKWVPKVGNHFIASLTD